MKLYFLILVCKLPILLVCQAEIDVTLTAKVGAITINFFNKSLAIIGDIVLKNSDVSNLDLTKEQEN